MNDCGLWNADCGLRELIYNPKAMIRNPRSLIRNGKAMFKNYLKIALRNLRKQSVYSFINVTGLAIGMHPK